MSRFQTLAAAFLLSTCGWSWAHEFWIEAGDYAPAVARGTDISVRVGERYVGDLVGITASHAAAIRVVSAAGTQDLGNRIPSASMLPALRLSFTGAGAHIVTYDSHPSGVELPADKFHAYLEMEGLGAIIRQREAAGTAAQPGRERFRRNAKALLRVGGRTDRTTLAVTGQRFEIIPLVDPLAAKVGDALTFELRFEGKPVSGLLLKAWSKRTIGLAVQGTSDDRGRVTLKLPSDGRWMLNTVHMVPATGVPGVDWDSFWSSLTFDADAGGTNAR